MHDLKLCVVPSDFALPFLGSSHSRLIHRFFPCMVETTSCEVLNVHYYSDIK